MATTRSVATVFGGSGFIGRYVVQRLAHKGYVVRVAVRNPAGATFLKVMGVVGQIVPLYASVTNEATVARAVEGADLVVNLVGILAERRGRDFQSIHAEGAGRVARLAAAAGVFRLAHVSAIGADPASPGRYGTSKAAGEQAVRQHFPAATILRPSVVFGPEDQFFNRFASMAMFSPVMPVFSGATRFQPVYVGDVADAIIAALAHAEAAGGVYELGGPRVMSFREVLRFVLEQTGRRRLMLPVPHVLARLMASVMEWLPGQPLTRDQLRMLSRDNVVTPGAPGLVELGVPPTPVEMVVPGYLRRFRPGGGRGVIRERTAKGDKSDLSYPISDAV
ncbi:MAG TPA: complex I NDUFA9 subunit family protein [Acetobacteraceae bacterium]|nr:complex I NDUFA9 subunit family protein [Acetobacteraceae bacterium]